jgi:hypothetical protein
MTLTGRNAGRFLCEVLILAFATELEGFSLVPPN